MLLIAGSFLFQSLNSIVLRGNKEGTGDVFDDGEDKLEYKQVEPYNEDGDPYDDDHNTIPCLHNACLHDAWRGVRHNAYCLRDDGDS